MAQPHVGPPIFWIPDELLLLIQSFIRDPDDVAHLASTCRHMWNRIGVDEFIHIREARFWERLRRQNQESHDRELAIEATEEDEVNDLMMMDPETAMQLHESHLDHRYRHMQQGRDRLAARPPTLLLAIARGCTVDHIQRILRCYRQRMPGRGFIEGLWGVSCRPGPSPTHTAVRFGRIDVLRLLVAESAFTAGLEWQGTCNRDLQGRDRFTTFDPLVVAIAHWKDEVAQFLLDEGHITFVNGYLDVAVDWRATNIVDILVTAYELLPGITLDMVAARLRNLLQQALRSRSDVRAMIDLLIARGADLTDPQNYQHRLLPLVVNIGVPVNAIHLLGRLAQRNALSSQTFGDVAVDATIRIPDHDFLRAAIPLAHLLFLPPDVQADVSRQVAREAGLSYLLRVELDAVRPGASPALRTAGVGLLIDAGVALSPEHFNLLIRDGSDEAFTLLRYLAHRGCPLDPPWQLRRRDDYASGPVFHPLRYAACDARDPRIVACLLAHGAKFADPVEPWVAEGIWCVWHAVFNRTADQYWAERDHIVARAQMGQFRVSPAIFGNADPDPVLLAEQMMTLYLFVFRPPARGVSGLLLCGELIQRDYSEPSLFDIFYYLG